MAIADRAAADEGAGVAVVETAIAGRSVILLVVAVEDFETDGVQRPHLAAGGLVLAVDGFEAAAIGQAGKRLAHVRLDARQ